MAILSIDGGGNLFYTPAVGVTTNVRISTTAGSSYTIVSTGDNFTSIPAGWSGIGGSTATGTFSSGDLTKTITIRCRGTGAVANVRSVNHPTTVTRTVSGVTATVNLSSNAPTNTGDVASIKNNVTVTSGDGTFSVVASASGANTVFTMGLSDTVLTGLLGDAQQYSLTLTNTDSSISGLTIKSGSAGSSSLTPSVNPPRNTTFNGGGGNTNTLDLSALSGYSDAPNGDGTGVVTLSNGKTIAYSGMIVAPSGGFSLINSGLCRSPLLGGLVR